MTIKDIAKIAGVSPSTVSRVVNGGDGKSASAETQERIWKVVRETGYMPNQHARSLQAKIKDIETSGAPGEIVCVYGRIVNTYLDPFFGGLMHAIEKAAFKRGYILRYSTSPSQNDVLTPPIGSSNAIIILGRISEQSLVKIQVGFKHILYTGLQNLPFEIDQVISSGYAAAEKCVKLLLKLGHRKIIYIGETNNEQRFQAYQDTMEHAGLSTPNEYKIDASFSPGQGYEAVNNIIERKIDFTAIFCPNDIIAIGALKALKEHHFKIPEDISLISINDIETAQYLSPMLTTVRIPIDEMGSIAAKTIIDRVEGGHHIPVKVELPNAIIHRESCGPCKKR